MAHPSADPVKFAYWVPNVSGGLVTSDIEQRTDWSYEYNRDLAVLAENNGFEYALSQVRYMASYGAEYQHESTSFSLALLLATERLKVIAAVHPGLWHPGVLAKFIATADQISGRPGRGQRGQRLVQGRVHRARRAVARARRALPPLRGVHPRAARDLDRATTPSSTATSTGCTTSTSSRSRSTCPGARTPRSSRAATRPAARAMAGRVSDWYFSNGKDFDGVTEQIDDVNAAAAEHGRTVRFGLNGFMIARDTETEARDTLREIIAKAERRGGRGLRRGGASRPGQSTGGQEGHVGRTPRSRTSSSTTTASAPSSSARRSRSRERIVEYKKRGVDLLLLGFLHYLEEVEYFGKNVLPIVRDLEADAIARGELVATAS